MLISLAQWLQTLSPEFGFFRVFQYLTFRAVMAALTALLMGLIAGPIVIRRLELSEMLNTRYNAAINPMADCQRYFSRERMPSGSL